MEASTRRLIRDILWWTFCGAVLVFAFTPSEKRPARSRHHLTEAELDEMIEETFPASDPPSY